MAKGRSKSVLEIIKKLFTKYQRDHGNIIVSSISFYVLMTFIPFTLLSIFVLGYVIDMSNPAMHLERFLKNVVPDPYNTIIVTKALKELNIISLSKKLSGPLGLLFLFFFNTRLFAVMRPSFQIIFGKTGKSGKGFIKNKGEEWLLTLLFSALQTILFFSFIFSLVIQGKVAGMVPLFLTKTPLVLLFSLLDMAFVFIMFFLLYYFLTPVKDKKMITLSTVLAAFFWHAGKYLFKYFVVHVGKVTAFFGTYGVFIAFLFWVYFSVFVFIVGAELLSILRDSSNRGPLPKYVPFQGSPSKGRRA